MNNKSIRLYNVLFPVWMLFLFPLSWLIVLPGNFAFDSLVLLVSMICLGIVEKKQFYKKHILKVFLFGLLADAIGSAYMLLLTVVFHVGQTADEWYLTVPGLIISAVCIFVFDYSVTFKEADRPLRLRLSLIYAVVTAPYTFLVPTGWLY